MDKIKMLAVLGEGGHTAELLNLISLLGDRYYRFSYVVSKEDNLSLKKIKYSGPVYYLSRPRGKDTSLFGAGMRTLLSVFQSFRVLLSVKPRAIISSGPAIAVPISILGRLLGMKVVFVETGSRIMALSLTGRIMYHWAHLFFVQWPQLKDRLPRALYAGRLI